MTHFTVAVSWQIEVFWQILRTILCTGVVWVSLVQHWMIRCTILCSDAQLWMILSTGAPLWMILSTGAPLWMILSSAAAPWMIHSIVVLPLLIPSTGILCTETHSMQTLCTGDQLWMLIGGCLLGSVDVVLSTRALHMMTSLWQGGRPMWMLHW